MQFLIRKYWRTSFQSRCLGGIGSFVLTKIIYRTCVLVNYFMIVFFRTISVFCDVSITQIFDTVNTFFRNKFTFSEIYVTAEYHHVKKTVISLSFTYQPCGTCEAKGMSKMEFAKAIDISSTTLAKLSKNEPITLSTIDKICNEFWMQN